MALLHDLVPAMVLTIVVLGVAAVMLFKDMRDDIKQIRDSLA